MHKVFVYGTLKAGYGNHRSYLHSAEALGEASTVSRHYALLDLGAFPGAVRHREGGQVHGELYRVDDATLRALDRLEGNGSFYQRQRVHVLTEEGTRHLAWMYLLIDSSRYDDRVLHDGIWPALPPQGEVVAYVFGYGSLLQRRSREQTTGRPSGSVVPVLLAGFERGWFHPGVGWTPLGLLRCPHSSTTGVLIPVTRQQLAAVDRREAGYQRQHVGHNHVAHQYGSTPIDPALPIYTYVSPLPMPSTEHNPVLQSYQDVFLHGALEHGAEFAADTLETTVHWDSWIDLDRADPRYPRADRVASTVAARLDDRLDALAPLG